jgi:hypothetical protein
MLNSSSAEPNYATPDTTLWQSLKSAIAASSGFQSWRSEQREAIAKATVGDPAGDPSDDQLVRLYLRDTLETLAY